MDVGGGQSSTRGVDIISNLVGLADGPADSPLRGVGATPFPTLATYKPTDMGTAERLRDRHWNRLRFIPGVGWHVWDEKRWIRDEDGAAMRLIKETVRSMWRERDTHETEDARDLVKYLRSSESEPRLRAALSLASSDAALVVAADTLDADPWLLNVENGTLDLRSGALSRHDRTQLITKLSPVQYREDATSAVVESVS
jgi:putative DNA primase/helicase